MRKTPKSLRLHIGLFGRTNVGKSSFLNMISAQDVAITSSLPGTTTDVVEKTMELLPLGPVVFLDTGGLDDSSALSKLRIKKTKKIFDISDIFVLIIESNVWGQYEDFVLNEAVQGKLPCIVVINKIDIVYPGDDFIQEIQGKNKNIVLCSSVDKMNRDSYVEALKKELIRVCPEDFFRPPPLVGDLLPAGGTAVLMIPIDLEAPKGRLILPQVQVLRDILDNDAAAVVVKEREYRHTLDNLKKPPDICICDSQVVLKMVADTPKEVKCTTFSIVFSRYKGDLIEMVRGVIAIESLKPGDKVLIAEACSHHPIGEDIGRVKIPRWLCQYTGMDLVIDVCSGHDYPENLKDYKLIIHCGGCMITRRQMLFRIQQAKKTGVPITNYGICISFLQGVLERVLSPFPAAGDGYKREISKIKRSLKMTVELNKLNSWIKDRIKKEEIIKYQDKGKDFIPEQEIISKLDLNSKKEPDNLRIKDILLKSLEIQTLTPDETAALLMVKDKKILEEMMKTALEVKKKVYDNRIVTFAPLYLNNLCINNCVYCGFRKDNKTIKRKILSLEEVKKEVKVLAGDIGHKRLIVVYGEAPETDIEYIRKTIKTIYGVKAKTKNGWGQIRRVNVNAPALSIEELKLLHEVGIGTYQVFQETYHKDTYSRVHPSGTIKNNYQWRLYCMHRAFEAGIDDVGIGVLFGLYDWKFEVMSLLYHARELERRFNVGPHTVSFPRLEPAFHSSFTQNSKYKVSDEDFKRLITVIRLSIPYTGMIITARESADIRRETISLGCTQTDASTRIGIGAYSERYDEQEEKRQQFLLGDTRSLNELIRELAGRGYITSFCTAGYRCGRTGKCIMELLKNGKEGKFCKLNAVLTFREWIDDFAEEETKAAAESIINKEIEEIKKVNPEMFPVFISYYGRIKQGERDLYL